ncbi:MULTISPECIES: DUF3027 domain-containing protein [unclassified Brevibacterium]|uniref:DUF3027 domain-containing protein n=1 Tax=unclassified Brevibacterium TaxID=2614124 RepID=UPI001E64FD44|nr:MULTISPECIES: DUF3027 domain-containing protein [unclassified Brevibacterium]MCD1285427.1 DUF3027 domain-containing protein [Brevibacterium sp. CCUG 69071]MDK8434477.1 DUF3027 domain-containing protein [Brevibacterium sp. H-BE7]
MSSLFNEWLARQTAQPNSADPAGTTATAASDAETAASDAAAAPADTSGTEAATASAKPAKSGRTAKSGTEKIVLDTQLAAAIDIARSAITEVAGTSVVGEHLGSVAEATRLVTHYFVCTDPTYRGWRWVAVLARAPRSKKVTVCETALLPGPDALVAPEWVPWDQRLEPGDLTPRDTLPKLDRDPNLQPGFQQTEDNAADNIDQIANFEFGIGRERVLSADGISAAASRWADSDAGPEGEFASRASAHCGSCGYLMPIAGSLRTKFGVCASEWSPFDGRVVGLESGCGAHSETDAKKPSHEPADAVVDDYAAGELEYQEG